MATCRVCRLDHEFTGGKCVTENVTSAQRVTKIVTCTECEKKDALIAELREKLEVAGPKTGAQRVAAHRARRRIGNAT